MEPKFLPQGWNVNHKIFRDFGEHSKFKAEYEFDSDLGSTEKDPQESMLNQSELVDEETLKSA
jgi:hypothetical protein